MSNYHPRIFYILTAVLIVANLVLFWRLDRLDRQLKNRNLVLEQLTLVDADGIARLKLQAGGDDYPTLLALFDAQGQMRWLMAAENNGQSGLSLIADDAPRWSMALAEEGIAYEMRDGIKPMIAEWPDTPAK